MSDTQQTERLVLHHLQLSQSERVVWLLEELGLPYQLRLHQRDPNSGLGPKSIKDLHSAGTAPVLEDTLPDGTQICISESGAIVEYILSLHGRHRLTIPPEPTAQYASYVEWLHFANGTLQAIVSRKMVVDGTLRQMASLGPEGEKAATEGFVPKFLANKLATVLGMLDARLEKSKYLAGEEVTVPDIMTVFSLTTMRGFVFVDLTPYSNILRYLNDISNRPLYKRAMKRGDPDLEPMIKPKYETGFVFGGKPFFDARS